jgi:very-short-patch-repair endonuclease
VNILQNAKKLRTSMTEAEQKLWYQLRSKRFANIKFKRQKPIGPYIVDFVAVNQKLVIELDGSQHFSQEAYDEERTLYLKALDYRVLRFWNHECLVQTDSVLSEIAKALENQF